MQSRVLSTPYASTVQVISRLWRDVVVVGMATRGEMVMSHEISRAEMESIVR